MAIISQQLNQTKQAVFYNIMPTPQQVHLDYGLWIFYPTRFDNASPVHIRKTPIPRYFNFYNISHLLDGKGWLWRKDYGSQDFQAGQAVIMAPGIIHDYSAYDHYHEDYLCFAGPVADHLARSGVLQPGIVDFGAVRRLLPIIELASDPGRDSQITAAFQLQTLLMDLYREQRQSSQNPRKESIVKLIAIIRKDPAKNRSVQEMAEMVNLSINQFIRTFHKATGLTPKKYCENLKMNLATEALKNSSRSILSIAADYGFRDQFHFSRRFRAVYGFSPSQYRKTEHNK